MINPLYYALAGRYIKAWMHSFIIRHFLCLTILFNVQKLSISTSNRPGNRSVNRSSDNSEFLSWRNSIGTIARWGLERAQWKNSVSCCLVTHSVLVQDFVSDRACCVNQYHYESRKRRVVMRLVHATGKTWYKVLYQHNMHAISLSTISIKTNFKQINIV
jgi:hypothetical protein